MPKKKPAKKSKPSAKKKVVKAKKKAPAKGTKSAKTSKIVKPARAPQPLAPKPPKAAPGEKFLGEVEDYFGKISVIALTVKEAVNVGDTIHVLGHTTDFTQVVQSMQIEHKAVKSAKKKDGVGILVGEKARKGDSVYLV